jgi:hypothetical protein
MDYKRGVGRRLLPYPHKQLSLSFVSCSFLPCFLSLCGRALYFPAPPLLVSFFYGLRRWHRLLAQTSVGLFSAVLILT